MLFILDSLVTDSCSAFEKADKSNRLPFDDKYGNHAYSHPALWELILEVWFKKGEVGLREFDRLKVIPLPMIALAVTSVSVDLFIFFFMP